MNSVFKKVVAVCAFAALSASALANAELQAVENEPPRGGEPFALEAFRHARVGSEKRGFGVFGGVHDVRHAKSDEAHDAHAAFGPFGVEQLQGLVAEGHVVARGEVEMRLPRHGAEVGVAQL